MPYSKTTWVNHVTALSPTHLNNMEDGIAAAPYGPDAALDEVPVGDGAGGWTMESVGSLIGSAGGDLTGTFPAPTIASSAVTVAKLASAVTLDAIATAHSTAADVAMNAHGFTGLSGAAAATDLTVQSGTGLSSGDTIFKTNGTEQMRLTFAGILYFNHGDPVTTFAPFTPSAGKYLDIRHGYTATPDTGTTPSVRLIRTLAHVATTSNGTPSGTNGTDSTTVVVHDTTGFASSGTFYISGTSTGVTYTGKTGTTFTGCGTHASIPNGTAIADFAISGDGAENLATLSVKANSTNANGVQPVGVYSRVENSGTSVTALTGVSPDACAVYGHGAILSGGNGVAGGGCFVAVKQSGSTGTNTSVQLFSLNNVSASSYSATGVSDTCLWVNAGGSYQSGAGMLFATQGMQFDVGIGFLKVGSVSSVKTAAISDDSDSVTSLRINGSHTWGIDLNGGTFSTGAIRLPNAKSLYTRNPGGTADIPLIGQGAGGAINIGNTDASIVGVVIPNNVGLRGTNTTASTSYQIGAVDNTDKVRIGDGSVALQLLGTSISAIPALGTNLSMGSHKITLTTPGAAFNEVITWPGAFVGPLKDAQFFGPTASDAWNKPATGTLAVVYMRGGGGSGGGGTTVAGGGTVTGGAGGGSGGWVAFAVPLAALGATVQVIVAAGGAAAAAGAAGNPANRTTTWDSNGNGQCTTAATITAAGGGTVGGGANTGGSAGATVLPVYTGYPVVGVKTDGGVGGASGANGATGSGGGGGGVTAGTGQTAGTGNQTTTAQVFFSGAAATKGLNGTPSVGSPAISMPNLNGVEGGGGGGGNDGGSGNNGGTGASGYAGGGGGGGGSCVTGGTAGASAAGGDAFIAIFVY